MRERLRSGARAGLLLLAAVGAACVDEASAPTDVEILWDRYAVPHVRAESHAGLFRGFGWAQAHSHGDLLLLLYAQARGRAAEHFGASFLASDRWVWTNGIPERAAAWLDAQEPEFRRDLEAFAAGVNAYARRYPERLDPASRGVLPVSAVDLLAHYQRVIHFSLVASADEVEKSAHQLGRGGSNGWAVAPSRSASGRALLLANPHLPWSERYLFYEADLACPGVHATGATLVGLPVLGIAFNDALGWTHTINTCDGVDAYELVLEGDGYRWDGEVRAFERERRVLRARRADGSAGLDEHELTIRRSVHGPLVAGRGERAVALRVVGLDRPEGLRQWWEMARAADLAQFEAALRLMQLPTFTVIYADRAGNVLNLFGGLTPRRPPGDLDWSGFVPGDGAASLWTETLAYDELPRVLNPPSGWVQNANEPPWTATLPRALDPGSFPPYLAPRSMTFAAQRSLRMLAEDESIGFEELLACKHSARMELADRLLDDLIAAAEESGGELAREAAAVLASWDRCALADSRGALLFVSFLERYQSSGPVFAIPWDESRPLDTPDGLADRARALTALESAAASLRSGMGALDAPWGDVFRLRAQGLDLPCNGGTRSLGIFRTFEFSGDPDGRKRAVSGDSFVAAVEFADPVRARVLTTYGNASQRGVPSRRDQLELAARGELRPAWRTAAEIEANLSFREHVPLE